MRSSDTAGLKFGVTHLRGNHVAAAASFPPVPPAGSPYAEQAGPTPLVTCMSSPAAWPSASAERERKAPASYVALAGAPRSRRDEREGTAPAIAARKGTFAVPAGDVNEGAVALHALVTHQFQRSAAVSVACSLSRKGLVAGLGLPTKRQGHCAARHKQAGGKRGYGSLHVCPFE